MFEVLGEEELEDGPPALTDSESEDSESESDADKAPTVPGQR